VNPVHIGATLHGRRRRAGMRSPPSGSWVRVGAVLVGREVPVRPGPRAVIAALLLVSLQPAAALADPSESLGRQTKGSSHARARAAAAGGTTWVFSTDQTQFRPGTSNQGWWSNQDLTRNSNDNYIVGRCCGAADHRNFFTFDLSELDGTVVSATLVVRKFLGRGAATETLRLFDVLTEAATLNDNRAIVPRIYKDLGRGHRYGTFALSTVDEMSRADVFELSLHERALPDIQSAAGGFFSIGGRLLTAEDGGFLFGGSSGHGKQLLLVETA
jgi:hypothetical protein